MSGKPIQGQFWERVIEAFADLARTALASVGDLEKDEFFHVSEPLPRWRLSEVFYSREWAAAKSKNQRQFNGLGQALRTDADRLIPKVIRAKAEAEAAAVPPPIPTIEAASV